MFNCSIGSGSFCASFISSDGGFSIGTVILSLPGISALRGGSFILLPPPPPPPPGPGWFNQMMLAFGCSGRTAGVAPLGALKRTRKMTNAANTTCQTAEATAAGAMRFCVSSNRNGISTGCCPSTWTERWPADSFARTSAVGVGSAIGNAKGVLVEVLSRTGLSGRNCKTGASAAEPVFLRRMRSTTGLCP